MCSECSRAGTQDREEMAGGEGAVDAMIVTVLVKSYMCFGLDIQPKPSRALTSAWVGRPERQG